MTTYLKREVQKFLKFVGIKYYIDDRTFHDALPCVKYKKSVTGRFGYGMFISCTFVRYYK